MLFALGVNRGSAHPFSLILLEYLRAFLDHRHGFQSHLFERQNHLGAGKPTVEQNVFGSVAGMQRKREKAEDDFRRLCLGKFPNFRRIASFIVCFGLNFAVFRVLCGQQTEVNRQERRSVRPPQSQHPKPQRIAIARVVVHSGQQFHTFGTRPFKDRIAPSRVSSVRGFIAV